MSGYKFISCQKLSLEKQSSELVSALYKSLVRYTWLREAPLIKALSYQLALESLQEITGNTCSRVTMQSVWGNPRSTTLLLQALEKVAPQSLQRCTREKFADFSERVRYKPAPFDGKVWDTTDGRSCINFQCKTVDCQTSQS